MGGLYAPSAGAPPPGWTYYANVPAIRPAADRVSAAGGRVVNGPMEVPGGQWILHGLDPRGVMFALVAPVEV